MRVVEEGYGYDGPGTCTTGGEVQHGCRGLGVACRCVGCGVACVGCGVWGRDGRLLPGGPICQQNVGRWMGKDRAELAQSLASVRAAGNR
eukprot:364770-Chlamydomonas_euryale.AAC.2